MNPSILLAGVGNIFLGDDAFGVETVRALAAQTLPVGVSAVDFGIRGFDLAFALLHPWDAVIIIDALSRGEPPGTLFTVKPNLTAIAAGAAREGTLNPHGMDPMHVLRLALSMGPIKPQLYVLGCEPEDFGDGLEGRMGLSPTVQASVPRAVAMLEILIGSLTRTLAVDTTDPALTT
jgi:hydrogenase maturation protease